MPELNPQPQPIKLPVLQDFCWLFHEGRPMKCLVIRGPRGYYCGANAEAFVATDGQLVGVHECITLPPGRSHETFAPWVEGEPAPAFIRTKAGYFIPASTPPKKTPLF